ncbi:MAG: DUF3231 family protein, partial [Desulfitobacteriaceae bacterium]|nr:DUF3231 family protein [Desulfitobacteriaceae bacterium]
MNSYTMVLNYITRSDLRGFFSTCIQESTDLLNLTVDALEQQGLYIRSPRVEYLKNNNYINNQNFLNAGLFGKKRNLLAGEITAIFASLRQNKIGA